MVVENRCFKESSKGWFSAKSRPFIGMVLALVMAVNFAPFQYTPRVTGSVTFSVRMLLSLASLAPTACLEG